MPLPAHWAQYKPPSWVWQWREKLPFFDSFRPFSAAAGLGVQKEPDRADTAYGEALRILVALRSTIKKARVFLQSKLEAGNFAFPSPG